MLDLRSIQINFIHSGFSTPLPPSGGTSIIRKKKKEGKKKKKKEKNRRTSARKIAKRSLPYERKIALPLRKKIDSNVLERGARFERRGRGGHTGSRAERTKEGRKSRGRVARRGRGACVVAARQSTNGIFDGGRSVIHGSLRGHCIRSAGVTLLPVEANCPPRVDRCCAACLSVNAKQRERDEQKKRKGRRKEKNGWRRPRRVDNSARYRTELV